MAEFSLVMDDRLKSSFAYCSKFSAENDIRYSINGLLFKKSNDYIDIVGTNGHILALSHIKLEGEELQIPDFEVILPIEFVKQWINKMPTKSWETTTITIENNSLEVTLDNAATFKGVAQEGKYPDYNRVIPINRKEIGSVSINTEFLKVLYDAHKLARKYNSNFKKTMGVTLESTSEQGVIIATPEGVDYITAVIMPMRV